MVAGQAVAGEVVAGDNVAEDDVVVDAEACEPGAGNTVTGIDSAGNHSGKKKNDKVSIMVGVKLKRKKKRGKGKRKMGKRKDEKQRKNAKHATSIVLKPLQQQLWLQLHWC